MSLTEEMSEAIRQMIREELEPIKKTLKSQSPPTVYAELTCPDCGLSVGDPFKHAKTHVEPKTLKVEVPVEKKRTLKQILSEHDIFECQDCMEAIEEHFKKKGLKIKIVEKGSEKVIYPKEEEKEWEML